MSSTPFDPSGQPEYLTSHAPQEPRKGRKKVVALAAVGVVVAGAVGAGAWAVSQLVGGGPGAASVLPDTALIYAAVDLDPSASQKVEAFQTIKKFPALDEELDLGSRDDIRRWVFDMIVEDGECKGLDYGDDIEPWIGDKLGVAAVPGDKDYPDPVIALQVTDEGKAEQGIEALFEACDPDETYGIAFLDGYALLAETDEIAGAAKSAAEKAPLADDAGYNAAVDELGTLGIATVYVSPEGPAALTDNLMAQMAGGAETPSFCTETPPGLDEEQLAEIDEMCEGLMPSEDAGKKLDEVLADFEGGAATLRFEDGGVELAAAGKGLPALGSDVTSVADLPASTVAALGFSLPEGWTETLQAQLEASFGPMFFQQMMAEVEADTGLQLPEDLEKAFGTDSVVALDGSTDFDALADSDDPSGVKAGIRVASDEADVRRVISALLTAAGAPADFVKVEADGGRVAVGFDEGYVGQLLGGGDLGDGDTFQDAVAEADKARLALFVDFDAADGWLERFVAATGGSDDDVANAKPLSAFGLSGWLDGETTHLVVRLSTD